MTSIDRAARQAWWLVLVVALCLAALAGGSWALVQNSRTVARLSNDEECLKSVVAANSDRSEVLTRLSKQRTDADKVIRRWNVLEQRAFQEALKIRTPADRARVRRHFDRANRGLLDANALWLRLDTAYNQAAQAHPVPKLKCTAGHLDRPAATVTASETVRAPAPSPSTVTATPHALPGVTVTRTVPGPTSTVTAVRTRTITVPPGKPRGRHPVASASTIANYTLQLTLAHQRHDRKG